jgi:micrococcal nuclease
MIKAAGLTMVLLAFAWSGVDAQQVTVKKTYNGNTIKLSDGKRVRYIGVSVPDKETKPFFGFCRDANRALVEGKEVIVLTDVLKKDDDGKMLGYVYHGDLFVNAELIRLGFGLAYTLPPNDRHAKLFQSMQKEARSSRRGLWAYEDASNEAYYVGSNSEKVFHRPGCFHVKNLSFDDKVIFRDRDKALEQGFGQDWRCCPLFRAPERK